MTTTALPRQIDLDQRFLIQGVSWSAYGLFLRALSDRHIFVTYDQGRMELRAPSWEHERAAEHLALLIRLLARESNIRIVSGGSTTFRREDVARGLEPDNCFYIQHVDDVLGKRSINLEVDPPPDLAIEVEVTRRVLDRISIY